MGPFGFESKVWRTAAIVIAAGLCAGCSDDGTAAGAEEGSSSSAGDGASSTQTATATATATATGTSTTTSAGSEDGANFISPTGGGSGGGEPQPNGGMCGSNDGCTSGFCFMVPMLGGLCSECLSDSDCGTGTCSLDFGAGYAVCTDGSVGNMCDSDEGCMGALVCAELIDTGGIFPLNFCSECRDDAGCGPMQLCSPTFQGGVLGGYLACVDPGTVPDNDGCPLDAGGQGNDAACASGVCSVVSVQGFLDIGVCGQCDVDADCLAGQTCTPASAGAGGLVGGVCS